MSKKKVGRPSGYTPEIVAAICERIGLGESLRAICEDKGMPSKSMVMRWLVAHAEFRDQYAGAREAQADFWAEQIIEIADTPLEGVRTEDGKDGSKTVREDMLGHRRLQVDTRKWLMSKLAPKKYGDRLTSELVGKDNGPILFETTTDDDRAKALAVFMAKQGSGK